MQWKTPSGWNLTLSTIKHGSIKWPKGNAISGLVWSNYYIYLLRMYGQCTTIQLETVSLQRTLASNEYSCTKQTNETPSLVAYWLVQIVFGVSIFTNRAPYLFGYHLSSKRLYLVISNQIYRNRTLMDALSDSSTIGKCEKTPPYYHKDRKERYLSTTYRIGNKE